MKTKFSLFGLLLIMLVSLTSMDTPKQKLTGDCGECVWQTCGDGVYRYQSFCYNEGLPGVFWCKPCGGGWLVKK